RGRDPHQRTALSGTQIRSARPLNYSHCSNAFLFCSSPSIRDSAIILPEEESYLNGNPINLISLTFIVSGHSHSTFDSSFHTQVPMSVILCHFFPKKLI